MAVTARGYVGRFASWLWPDEPLDPISAGLTWTGAVLGVLVPIIVLLPVGPVVKTLAVLLFACSGPGAAVICRVRLGNAAAAWAMAMVLSLSVMSAVSVAMAWLRFWHPLAGFLLVGAATAGASVPILARRRWWPGKPLSTLKLSDVTRVLPRLVNGGSDTTSVLPRLVNGGSDTTSVLPRLVDGGSDTTSVLPRLVNGGSEATSVLPRVIDDPRAQRAWSAPPPMLPEPPPDWRRASAARTLPSVRVEAARPRPARRAVTRHRTWPNRLLTGRNLADALPLVAGVILWVIAVTHSDVTTVGDYGLLPRMYPTFFAAIVLCATGFIAELYRPDWRGPVLLGYLALLLLILHATVPSMVYEPEYAWTYKHIGVMEYIRTHGAADNPTDIYLQWPTLFALGAQVIAVTGVSGLRLGAWAPLFFDTLNCLPLFAAARTLSSDRRVPYLTVFLFTSINWVAQDYLSPQAFTFVLCLGTLMIMLRWLRRVPGPLDRKPPRLILRLWSRLQNGLVEVPYTSARTRSIALGTLYFVYGVVATAHQLSPYIVVMGATSLVALGLLRPLRIAPVLIGIALLYLLPRYQVVDNYGLFNGVNFFHNARGNAPNLDATAGQAFSSYIVRLLALGVWGLASLAVFVSRRKPGLVAVPAVLGFAPFALLMAQSYGGEAIYRVFLFTAPWCAYLIVTMVLRWRWMPNMFGAPLAALALTGAMLACVQGEHGQLTFDRFSRSEVRAASYIYDHAPPHSSIVMAIANFPGRSTANYATLNDADLINTLRLQGHPLDKTDLPAILTYFQSLAPNPAFLVISPAMAAYAHFFGYVPDGAMDTLGRTVAGSPNFALYHRDQDVVIYRYVPS